MSNFYPEHRIGHKEAYELMEKAREAVGDDEIISSMHNFFDTDTVVWFLEQLDEENELGLFYDEEEEDE